MAEERPIVSRQRQAAPATAAAALNEIAAAQQNVGAIVRRQTRPWWMEAVPVAVKCGEIVILPIRLAIGLAEGAVALAVLSVLLVGFAWYSGAISDKDVAAALKPLGQRILTMVQSQAPGQPNAQSGAQP